MRRQDLEGLNREQLIAEAERLGVPRPRVLTQPELFDEIISRSTKNERERARARGWLGRARDLLAKVVEKGLHLPDAARAIRSTGEDRSWPAPPPPLPTVTLAEIYAAQGHLERAVHVLDEVLAREPDHAEAKQLRARFVEQSRARARTGKAAPAAPVEEAGESDATMDEAGQSAAPAESPMVDEKDATQGTLEVAAASSTAGEEGATSSEAEEQATIVAAPTISADGQATIVAAPTISADAATSAEVALVEVEPALSDSYDVDEVVAIAVDPRTIYLYWEVRATTLARAQARRPAGSLGVRVASVTASWDGPVVAIRDLRVDALHGDRFIRDVQPGSNVRVSVGWEADGEFEPFAVGIEVTAPHLAPMSEVAEDVARWTPIAGAKVVPWRMGAHAGAAPSPAGELRFGHQEPAGFAPSEGFAPGEGGAAPPGRSPPSMFERAAGVRSARAGEHPAQVISWNEQGWVSQRSEIVREGAWFQPGGASELGRGGPLYWLGGASELGRGGASELARG